MNHQKIQIQVRYSLGTDIFAGIGNEKIKPENQWSDVWHWVFGFRKPKIQRKKDGKPCWWICGGVTLLGLEIDCGYWRGQKEQDDG